MKSKIIFKVLGAIIEMEYPYEEILYGFGMLQVKLKSIIDYWTKGNNALSKDMLLRLKNTQLKVTTLTSSVLNNIYADSLVANHVNVSMIGKIYMSSLSIRNISLLRDNLNKMKTEKATYDELCHYNTDVSEIIIDATYDVLLAIQALDTKILRRAMYDIKASDIFNDIKSDICLYASRMRAEIIDDIMEEWV